MKLKWTLPLLVLCGTTMSVAQTSQGGSSPPPTNTPSNQAAPATSDSQPGSMAANSGGLQSQIENALRNEPALADSHLAVKVTADSIDLSGTVGSTKDKETAERIAQSFDGNRKLNDTLMVTGHGHSDLAPDHSAMNNGGTGNTKNPVTQNSNGNNSANPK